MKTLCTFLQAFPLPSLSNLLCGQVSQLFISPVSRSTPCFPSKLLQSGCSFPPANFSRQYALTGWWSKITPTISVALSGFSSSSPGSSNASPPPEGILTRSKGRAPSPSISSAIACAKSPLMVCRSKLSTTANSFFALAPAMMLYPPFLYAPGAISGAAASCAAVSAASLPAPFNVWGGIFSGSLMR